MCCLHPRAAGVVSRVCGNLQFLTSLVVGVICFVALWLGPTSCLVLGGRPGMCVASTWVASVTVGLSVVSSACQVPCCHIGWAMGIPTLILRAALTGCWFVLGMLVSLVTSPSHQHHLGHTSILQKLVVGLVWATCGCFFLLTLASLSYVAHFCCRSCICCTYGDCCQPWAEPDLAATELVLGVPLVITLMGRGPVAPYQGGPVALIPEYHGVGRGAWRSDYPRGGAVDPFQPGSYQAVPSSALPLPPPCQYQPPLPVDVKGDDSGSSCGPGGPAASHTMVVPSAPPILHPQAAETPNS